MDAKLEVEIENIREAIRGRPPAGRVTVAGVLRLDHMKRLQRMTGLEPDTLATLWDRIVSQERAAADGNERMFDLSRALEHYGERLIELAGQSEEVKPIRFDRWAHQRRRELLIHPV